MKITAERKMSNKKGFAPGGLSICKPLLSILNMTES